MNRAHSIISLLEKVTENPLRLSTLIKISKQGGKLKGYDIKKDGKAYKVFFQGKELKSDEFKFEDELALRKWLLKTMGKKV